MILKLSIGDWSEDGHGICDEVYIESNYDVQAIRKAYKDSCKKTGLTFNHGTNYTGLDLDEEEWRKIWTEYAESYIDEKATKILAEHGIEEFNDRNEDASRLIMDFISLSMPEDFEYKIVTIEAEPINGWWNSELNEQFGYGLHQ